MEFFNLLNSFISIFEKKNENHVVTHCEKNFTEVSDYKFYYEIDSIHVNENGDCVISMNKFNDMC